MISTYYGSVIQDFLDFYLYFDLPSNIHKFNGFFLSTTSYIYLIKGKQTPKAMKIDAKKIKKMYNKNYNNNNNYHIYIKKMRLIFSYCQISFLH